MLAQAIEAKAKKVPKQTQDFKAALEALQELLNAAAEDLAARAETAAHADAAAAVTSPSDSPVADTSAQTANDTDDNTSCSASQDGSSLPADGHLIQHASCSSAGTHPLKHREVQMPLDEANSGLATSGPASAGMSELEQQMSRLAMTHVQHAPAAPAAGTDLDPPQAAAASLAQCSPGTYEPGRDVQGEGVQTQPATQEGMSGVSNMEEPVGATAALQQRQPAGSSFSQCSGVMGPDLLKDSAADRDLPATQLQDSEMSAASQVQLTSSPHQPD